MEIKIVKDTISKEELKKIAENQFGDLIKAIKKIQRKKIFTSNWQKLSFYEQMGNIGSEISRALNWRDKDEKSYDNAIARAFELLDLTIADLRWRLRLKEIVRARELLADAMFGGKEYKTTFEDLNNYFFHFALAARINK
ncbi:hypothetical protein KKH14_02995 [Patescibacteria group bacterium]|nr:hypothetical protein [Patescibacteria group bacterium]